MSETLQQWAERFPTCKVCGEVHDLNPVLQDSYHTPRPCEHCGNTHRLADPHPPATPERMAEIKLFNAQYEIIEEACDELRQKMWAEFRGEAWPDTLEEKPWLTTT